jgi:UPF0755 protein
MVTVVEGLRSDEIGRRLEQLDLASSDEFLTLVRHPDSSLLPSSLQVVGETLEGYLFPSTYEWDRKAGLVALVRAMLREFDARVDARLRAKLAQRGLTLHEGLVLASIVERETARADERPVVASVYENRLKSDMPLQADPTVQYAVASLDPDAGLRLGLWRPLSAADLETDSPFNTYRHSGLPPAPICNPGLDSIEAVAEPAETSYLYFVARGDGSHAFARTQEEHAENVRKYQQ